MNLLYSSNLGLFSMGNLSAGSVFAEDLANSLAELWLSGVCAHLGRAGAPEQYVLTWIFYSYLFCFQALFSTQNLQKINLANAASPQCCAENDL